MPRQRNEENKTPKSNKTKPKYMRNNSKLLTSGNSRLNTENRALKSKNTMRKKGHNKSTLINKSPKPSKLTKSPKPTKPEYKYKYEGTTPTRASKTVTYTPNGHRVFTAKSKNAKLTKPVRPKSSVKKPMTPMKVSNRILEKKLESHLPSALNQQQPTKRKVARKSQVKKKRPLHEPKVYNNDKSFSKYEKDNRSPRRKPVSPLRSPKRKSPTRDNGRLSPTKRMIQMKNSYIKNQKKAQKDPQNSGKLVYTISPDEAYIVDQEFKDSYWDKESKGSPIKDAEKLAKRSEEL